MDTPPRRAAEVLFVDDDECLLDGLRDALRPYRHEWSMRFVVDAHQALQALDAGDYRAVVSDLRMPGMDGAKLLEEVRERHPQVVRIVLSGQADMVMVARASAVAHRIISKPCATADLVRVIERACALSELTERVERGRRARCPTALPAVPALYAALVDVLGDPSSGAAEVARVVERDMAIAAKVLQLANSAYFGRRSPVTSLSDAVAYLGLEAMRALVLQAELVKQFSVDVPIPGFDLDGLHRHSGHVARVAAAIAADTGVPKHAYTAGLLHDVGWLILAAEDPVRLSEILTAADAQGRPASEIERDDNMATHAEIGAHLLALWGLPPAVTEAVAGHHDARWLRGPFDEVAVVHIADALVRELEGRAAAGGAGSEIDREYLEHTGVHDRLDRWRQMAERQMAGSDPVV